MCLWSVNALSKYLNAVRYARKREVATSLKKIAKERAEQ